MVLREFLSFHDKIVKHSFSLPNSMMPIHLLHYVLYITKEIKEFLSYINTKLQKLHSFKRVECGSSSPHNLINREPSNSTCTTFRSLKVWILKGLSMCLVQE